VLIHRIFDVNTNSGHEPLHKPGVKVVHSLRNPAEIQEYADAFTTASGLPLDLDLGHGPKHLRTCDNPFCKLMARINPACKECLETQSQLRRLAQHGPRTMKCFAGLCETAVPLATGTEEPAFLNTGHVFLSPPCEKNFEKVSDHLSKIGVKINFKRARKAWLAGRVMPPEKYDAFVKLLELFARHVPTCAGSTTPIQADLPNLPPLMEKARGYILAHLSEELPLQHVAHLVNLSPNHFCRRFKAATGRSFTEFLAQSRVDHAKQMLRADPSTRISEVAYASGFQSISRFNRVFRQHLGVCPTEYRDSAPVK
jgi:AraC-like DNA-binding protein/ligand-binding sensor protein